MNIFDEGLLNFLSSPYEEECRKFLDLIPERVSAELLKARPDVTEKVFEEYLDCFVKKDWIGLTNTDKVHFKFSDSMPKRSKPPS